MAGSIEPQPVGWQIKFGQDCIVSNAVLQADSIESRNNGRLATFGIDFFIIYEQILLIVPLMGQAQDVGCGISYSLYNSDFKAFIITLTYS